MKRDRRATMIASTKGKYAVYHTGWTVSDTLFLYRNGPTWFLCDTASGLAVHTARTKKECMANAEKASAALSGYIQNKPDDYMNVVMQFAELDRITEEELAL